MCYAGTSKKYKFSYYIWYSRRSRPEKITIIGKGTEKLAPVMHYDFQNDQVPRAGVMVTGTIGRNYTVVYSIY